MKIADSGKRNAFNAASRWPAISTWFRWKTPAGIAGGWGSPSPALVSCLLHSVAPTD
jgi:hypothetical protein